jgi:organic hydroperoxide reductase OsmC/OhrA
MAMPFPHHYVADLSWSGIGGGMITAGPRPPIVGGAPPEFDGVERWWSPEHLLLSSLNLCLQTTFESLARKRRLAVNSYHSHAQATLDRQEASFGFTLITLEVSVACPSGEVDRVRDTLLKAKQYCLVANALKVPVHVKLDVTVWEPETAVAV